MFETVESLLLITTTLSSVTATKRPSRKKALDDERHVRSACHFRKSALLSEAIFTRHGFFGGL